MLLISGRAVVSGVRECKPRVAGLGLQVTKLLASHTLFRLPAVYGLARTPSTLAS